MRKIGVILIPLFFVACVGENVKKSKQSRERLDDRTKTALDASGATKAPSPLVNGIKGSNNQVSIVIKGEVPLAQSKSETKKNMDSNSVFDMSIKSAYEKVSGWLYLIMVISAWGAWVLYRRISQSAEGKALSGIAKTIYRSGKKYTEGMMKYAPSTPEWRVYNELNQVNNNDLAEAQRSAPPKK